jgi:hypothetical protein
LGTSLALVQAIPEAGALLCLGVVSLLCGGWMALRRPRREP